MINTNRLRNFIIRIVFAIVIVTQLPAQPALSVAPQLPNNSCVDCHSKLLFSSGDKQFIDIRIKHLDIRMQKKHWEIILQHLHRQNLQDLKVLY